MMEAKQTRDRKKHWEAVYRTKELQELSWHQPVPGVSLEFFKQFDVPLTAGIIDIGGGDSYLVDRLLDLGYRDLTVLDISGTAIDRAKLRLGRRADSVNWIVSDVAEFSPGRHYDFWHDRAAFHFLTVEEEISAYVRAAQKGISPGGVLVIGTFSEDGPTTCSGLKVRQYSEASMNERFGKYFRKETCFTVDHVTPSDAVQNYLFCSFRRLL